MILHLETCIHRLLYKLVLLEYFSKQDRDKILSTLKKQGIELVNRPYDLNLLIERYRQMLGQINERGISYLAVFRNKCGFKEKQVMAALIIEKYCYDNYSNDYKRSKAVQAACSFVIELC